MKKLPTVTLLGIDCVAIDRLRTAAEICLKDFEFADVKLLTSLPTENKEHVIPIKEINSLEAYSKFVIEELNDYVDTEYVLIIQYDGFILNPAAWTDEFLQYDYIGSPVLINNYAIRSFGLAEETLGDWFVGNGGFCIRSKKLLEKLQFMSKAGMIEEYHAEDVTICVKKRAYLEAQEITFAPIKLAEKFSFEYGTVSGKTAWTNEFGFHGLGWSDITAWVKAHPEYNIQNSFDRKNYD